MTALLRTNKKLEHWLSFPKLIKGLFDFCIHSDINKEIKTRTMKNRPSNINPLKEGGLILELAATLPFLSIGRLDASEIQVK